MIVTQKLASFLTTLRSIVLSLVFLTLIAWNFGAINTSAKEVLGMVSHVQQFEASGIKVVLRDDAKLKASLTIVADHLNEGEKRATIDAVQKLTGAQAERLFTIEKDQPSCDYTSPTPKMRLFLYSDAMLADLGLVEIKDNPDALDKETLRVAREGSNIGKPKSCYSMQLTPRGYDAKSALVGVIRQQLG